jgi:enoyl-CoA hydratase/carnithine racemase
MSIDYVTDGHVARLTINRTAAMNALDSAHNADLEQAWRRLNEDPQIRVGILTGAGTRSFCAGADLKELIPSHHRAARAATARFARWAESLSSRISTSR